MTLPASLAVAALWIDRICIAAIRAGLRCCFGSASDPRGSPGGVLGPAAAVI
jgi:hypothetical protein